MKKLPKSTIALLMLLIIAIGVIVFLVTRSPKVVTVGPEIENSSEVDKLENGINLPGYDNITLEAEKKEQTVMIPNPAENNCMIQVIMKLSDGTVLWESDEISPGHYSVPIVLNQKLKKGKYNDSVLHFDCYADDKNHTKLNGVECKFTLLVK